jgi:hypothetical protein
MHAARPFVLKLSIALAMLTLESPVATIAAPPLDPLAELQLRVARRADELSRGNESTPSRDVLLWFQAEKEILGADAVPAASSA